jgi:signal transduction histidine kinase
MMPRSLTSRLIFLYCVILLLLGVAFLGFTVLSFQHYTRQVITNLLSVRSQDIWRLSHPLLGRPDALGAVIEQHFSPETQNRFIRIRIGDKVLYQSGEPTSGLFTVKNVPFTAPDETPTAQLRGQVMLYATAFTGPRGEAVTVEAGQYQFTRTIQTQLTKSLFVGLPILLIMAGLAGWLVMRRALGPIEAMISAAESYSFNQPAKRLPTLSNEPRIAALGMALNRLLDRLDSAYSHVGRFTSDAAHELRTPLTIIRGELELIARQDLPADADQAIRNILDEMTRLSALVDSLITLSCMDSLWGKTTHATVDLKQLAMEVLEQMHLLLEVKAITVTPPRGGAVEVWGDRNRLKQVIVNLLDNAIKYTGENGRIAIRVYAEAGMGVVTVEDSGIGIAADHQKRIFDRFYRVMPDRGDQGAGLGLAIVKSICLAHGGKAWSQSTPGVGSCFGVEFPLAADPAAVGRFETALETHRL